MYLFVVINCGLISDFSNYSFVPCPTPLELHEKYQAFLKANGLVSQRVILVNYWFSIQYTLVLQIKKQQC